MILILLTILKIIGTLFLVLLGLIVLLICLVLFVPVKYRVKGAKHPDTFFVHASLSYLRPLVRVKIDYPSDTVLSVKILWIDLLHPKEKKQRQKKEKPESVTAQPMRVVDEAPVYEMDTFPEKSEVKRKQPDSKDKEKTKASETAHQKPQKKKPAAKKKAASRPQKETENKVVAIAALLWQYKEMYPDVLGRVFHALKSVLPRKCNIHLIFGTGSPDNTGYLYGAYCALQEYLPGTIVFEPVWMESYLDTEFELSGKIRLIHFITAAVKIIADKRVRKFVSEIRRL